VKVKRITLTVEPNDKLWGFSEMMEGMNDDCEAARIEAVIDLVNEDFMTMFEDAVWTVEFDESSPA
jgi:hypothetical protein